MAGVLALAVVIIIDGSGSIGCGEGAVVTVMVPAAGAVASGEWLVRVGCSRRVFGLSRVRMSCAVCWGSRWPYR